MKKIREVLRLKHGHGASTREIAGSCKLSVSTVSEYLYRSGAAGLAWPLPEDLSDEELEARLFPPRPKPGEIPRPLPDWGQVRRELCRKGVTLLLLWREYKALHSGGYGYSRFADLYAAWERSTDLRMLQRHKAGEKLFVDFAGLAMPVVDPQSGEVRQVQVFAGAMGSSQKLFAKAYEGQDLRSWLSAHVEAFEFYGAIPEILVPDNLKSGVTDPCYYEPGLTRGYAELAAFYDVAVLPARIRKPRDKAKVENGVQQVERWVLAPLRNRRFFSISELNQAIALQLAQVNARLMKGPQASRDELFLAEDLPAMRPLPECRYTYAQWRSAKVAPDYHVELDGHKYSVPYTLVAKRVELRLTTSIVEVFHGSKKIASHARSLSRRGFTTLESHMPESHKAGQWNPERLESWALKVGPQAAIFVSRVLASKGHKEHGYRTALGVLRLEKRYSKARLEAACCRANSIGALAYSSVKSILDKNLETVELQPQLPALPPHDNVRGSDYYKSEVGSCVS